MPNKKESLMGQMVKDFKKYKRRSPQYWLIHPSTKAEIDKEFQERYNDTEGQICVTSFLGIAVLTPPEIPKDQIQLV